MNHDLEERGRVDKEEVRDLWQGVQGLMVRAEINDQTYALRALLRIAKEALESAVTAAHREGYHN